MQARNSSSCFYVSTWQNGVQTSNKWLLTLAGLSMVQPYTKTIAGKPTRCRPGQCVLPPLEPRPSLQPHLQIHTPPEKYKLLSEFWEIHWSRSNWNPAHTSKQVNVGSTTQKFLFSPECCVSPSITYLSLVISALSNMSVWGAFWCTLMWRCPPNALPHCDRRVSEHHWLRGSSVTCGGLGT